MPFSMIRKFNCGEQKPTRMTLTLDDRLMTYPYCVLQDVLLIVDRLLFPINFMILDIPQDSETPLILGRAFLNVFEVMRHHN